MIWILATRGISTRLRSTPFTETAIDGAHSVVYKPGIEPIAYTGQDTSEGERGTYGRGLHRVSGYIFSYHGSVAEELLLVTDAIDLVIRYRANAQRRKRTLLNGIFIGDATVTVPGLNAGMSELTGVPFRLQIPELSTLYDHVQDTVDE
ncbi:MAG: hypothetical protein JSU63_01785 [Phycisphaerales bacterium]|nr:MAG: hypothetical protein JSU63_01785 [Phycisphaerales bacterium]